MIRPKRTRERYRRAARSPGHTGPPRVVRMPSRRSAPPRSLSDELRSRPDAALAALLRDRPDLAVPLPSDLSALGVRAASRLSVQRPLEGLDTPALQVLEVLAALPEPAAPGQVTALWGAPAGPVL